MGIERMSVFSGATGAVDYAGFSGVAPDKSDPSSAAASLLGDAQKFLLLLQFIVVNLPAFALLTAAYLQGWIDVVIAADGTGLSVGIFLVFLGGLAICAQKIWTVSAELNNVDLAQPNPLSWAARYLGEIANREAGSRAISASALRVKVFNRIAVVRHVANSLVLLGLIGTVLGFIIALSGVDPSVAGNVQAIAPMVTGLIEGMSVALYTTLVGAVLNLWLMVNYHMLAGGAVKLVTRLIAIGEANARH